MRNDESRGLDTLAGHLVFGTPLSERRQGLDQNRLAYMQLLGRFGPVDVATVERLEHLRPRRVLGHRFRPGWPAQALALGPGIDPVRQLRRPDHSYSTNIFSKSNSLLICEIQA